MLLLDIKIGGDEYESNIAHDNLKKYYFEFLIESKLDKQHDLYNFEYSRL